MTDKNEWQDQVGKAWAENWQLTDRSLAGLTQCLLDLIDHLPGQAVLDVGCGAGELSLAIARRRPGARVIGVDVSPDLVAAAGQRGGHHASVQFELGDAAQWSREGFAPDLLVSRHGVMFFDDPVAAFAHLRTIAADSARLAFSCFRWPQENPWMQGLAALIPGGPPKADPEAPGPFAFANPDRVTRILSEAGWSGIRIEPLDFAYVAGTGENALSEAHAFFQRIGPLARLLSTLEDNQRDAVNQHLDEWLARNLREGMIAFPAAAWQVTARKD